MLHTSRMLVLLLTMAPAHKGRGLQFLNPRHPARLQTFAIIPIPHPCSIRVHPWLKNICRLKNQCQSVKSVVFCIPFQMVQAGCLCYMQAGMLMLHTSRLLVLLLTMSSRPQGARATVFQSASSCKTANVCDNINSSFVFPPRPSVAQKICRLKNQYQSVKSVVFRIPFQMVQAGMLMLHTSRMLVLLLATTCRPRGARATFIFVPLWWLHFLLSHQLRGQLHGFDDILIAGAAAQVATQRLADGLFARIGIFF